MDYTKVFFLKKSEFEQILNKEKTNYETLYYNLIIKEHCLKKSKMFSEIKCFCCFITLWRRLAFCHKEDYKQIILVEMSVKMLY